METKKHSGKVGLPEKVIYGAGDVGLNVMYTIFSSYVMYFYTDVIAINAAIIGTVLLVSRIFDGISDLIAGRYIDTHKGRWGHCLSVIIKFGIPMALSVLLVFTVPDASIGIRVAYIFVTYNLFNTVMYTLLQVAHNALATYVTDDPVGRSQMLVFKMLFAAITQTVMANAIMPVVNLFGGQGDQMAWVKSVLLFGAIGLVFLALNAVFVHERVEVPQSNENFITSIKYALQNKYWLLSVLFTLSVNVILIINLSISVYYLNTVEGNMGLMGAYVSACNLPGIVIMLLMPFALGKVSKKNLALTGVILMIIGQAAFLFVPVGNTFGLIATAVIRGIGFSFPMGLYSAFVADTVDYGEWKTGTRVQTMLFSGATLGMKVGQGLLVSLFGVFIASIGYKGELSVQSETVVNGINIFFRWAPFVFYGLLLLCCILFDLEKRLPQIRKELVDRRGTLE